MKKIKTHQFHHGATQTAIILATAVLASCGGGGGSGGGSSGGSSSFINPVSLAQERDFNGAIGPINAVAAYERGYTGDDAVIHLINARVAADDNRLKTNVVRQFEIDGSVLQQVDKEALFPGTSTWEPIRAANEDTAIAQLIAEPRDGKNGLGIAYDAKIWAYDNYISGQRSGSLATAIEKAAERDKSEVINIQMNLDQLLGEPDIVASDEFCIGEQ